MKSIAMNSGGPFIPRSKSRANDRSWASSLLSRCPIPGGVTDPTISWSFSHSAVAAPSTALTAWCTGARTCTSTKTTLTKVSGAARSAPSRTAPTRTPVDTASRAGIVPRSRSSAHHRVASPGDARCSTRKNVVVSDARNRSSIRRGPT